MIKMIGERLLPVLWMGLLAVTLDQPQLHAQAPAPVSDAEFLTAAGAGDLETMRRRLHGRPEWRKPNIRDPETGVTPLMVAVLYGRTEAGRLLLSKRGNPNLVGGDGTTALHLAAFFGHRDLVLLLLEKGADHTLTNAREKTALELVSEPWSAELGAAYQRAGEGMGLDLDLGEIEKSRPQIAEILREHAAGKARDFNTTVPRAPLDPSSYPYWEHPINRDRLYDYYAKQAIHYGGLDPRARPEILPQFPGLDRRKDSHFGNQSDPDWRDDRANQMDFGAMVSGTLRGADRLIARAVCVDLGGGVNAVYNAGTQRFVLGWRGELVSFSDVRRGMQNGLYIGGEEMVEVRSGPALDGAEFLGIYRRGRQVAFAYEHGGERRFKTAAVEGGKVVERFLTEEEATAPGQSQWPERMVTEGQLGDHQPYAIDTLPLPYDNPWGALMFLGGVDFVSEERVAVSTLFGDVWVCDVADGELSKITWKRFAAGLYQPLGLKVIDGVIHVTCRDQIVALHDRNGDDEADFYQCVSAKHLTSTRGHSYVTGLGRDDRGRLYFASADEGVCRLPPGGGSLEVLATGLRYPNGLAVSPDGGVVLASLQEGNWTPASAIVEVLEGGHYGFGGPREGALGYVPPMVYLPRGEDNSSGGQAFIKGDRWGPMGGNWVHFSGSMARHFLVLREEIAGGVPRSQAAVVPLWGEFLSGSHRGRISPFDGQLYVAGAQGYLNYGTADGSLQRVRFTGGPCHYPVRYETRDNGILLHFAEGQADELGESDRWFAQAWNYRITPDYGSDEYSVLHPERTGHDPVEIRSVQLLNEDRTLFLEIPQLGPSNTLHLHFRGSEGKARRLEVFATIHQLGEPFTDFPSYTSIPKVSAPDGTLPGTFNPAAPATIRACISCHHPTERLVGPPLTEIRERYANNPGGIVDWAIDPQNKTPDTPPMPSFEFVGKAQLMEIAEEILRGE